MSIPKLKVYRLNNNYSESTDDDIQSMSKDELLPIKSKNLNVFDTQQMVGVKERGDSRLVVESNWYTLAFKMDQEVYSNSAAMQTEVVNCDGWVLGKGNFKVLVKIINLDKFNELQNETTIGAITKNNDNSITYDSDSDINYTAENGWYEIDPKFWDYEISDKKVYCTINSKSWESSDPDSNVDYIYKYNTIKFKLGDLLTKTNTYFNQGYTTANYLRIVNGSTDTTLSANKIIVCYKKYCEFGDTCKLNTVDQDNIKYNFNYYNNIYFKTSNSTDQSYYENEQSNGMSKYRVPFGQIYNGNKHGRCLYYRIKNSNNTYSYNCSTELPSDAEAVNVRRSYYQGNYLYKRRILPLRCLVGQVQGLSSDFVADSYIENGKCVFNIDNDWYLDGLMYPVVMERIIVDKGLTSQRKIFKQLQKNVQINITLSTSEKQLSVSFVNDYYKLGIYNDEVKYCYPKEIFLFYNKQQDDLGNIFDFNYYYKYFCDGTSSVGDNNTNTHQSRMEVYKDSTLSKADYKFYLTSYGYENRGILYSSKNINSNIDEYMANVLFGTDSSGYNYAYQKVEKLAVVNGFGYDQDIDFLMTNIKLSTEESIANVKNQYIPSDIQNSIDYSSYNEVIIPDNQEINFANNLLFKIYIDGDLCFYYKNSNEFNQNADKYFIMYEYDSQNKNNIFRIFFKTGTEAVKDVMISYYEKHKISMGKQSYEEYDNDSQKNVIKYKNPWCIGYRIPCYEKVKTSNLFVSSFPNWVKGHLNNDLDVFVGNTTYSGTSTSNSNQTSIYPKYQQSGWQALYSQGAVKFTDEITQLDYFDLFNFFVSNYNLTVTWDYLGYSNFNQMFPYNTDLKDTYSIYYNKVRYNVAHYDGIYTTFRGRMSNYSLQNGGASYKLLEDENNLYALNKRWITRYDKYVRLLHYSDQQELPIILNSPSNQKQIAEQLKQISVNSSNVFLDVNTNDNRIKVISFVPSYNLIQGVSANTGFILCIHNDISSIKQYSSIDTLQNQYVRLHVALGKSSDNISYKTLYIGQQVDDNGNFYQVNPSSLTNIKYLFPSPDIENTNYVKMKWYELPMMQDIYDIDNTNITSIDDVQNASIDVGLSDSSNDNNNTAIMKRFRYHNSDWYYDVYIQIYSYRYNVTSNQNYIGKETPLSKVELIIYRVQN